jgi:hypothetical protein
VYNSSKKNYYNFKEVIEMSEKIQKTTIFIETNAQKFIQMIMQSSENNRFKKIHKSNSVFSMLGPADEMFYEYAFYEQVLEHNIRENLINPIFQELFFENNYNCIWPNMMKHSLTSTVIIEDRYPLEFIICYKNERIGIRYTGLDKNIVKQVLSDYRLNRIIHIDWNGKYLMSSKEVSKYEVISPSIFFERFFTNDLYKLFIHSVKEAIDIANNIIGFKAFPKFSMKYLHNFKFEILSSLFELDYSSLGYIQLKTAVNENHLSSLILDENDYQIIQSNFIDKGLYKSLVGQEDFAKCFLTSEYLYEIVERGQNLDYTAVVSGYFKSIEQLIFKLIMINLEHQNVGELWIKKNSKKIPEYLGLNQNLTRKNPITKKYQVVFLKGNEKYFDTTLNSMIWFLSDNENGWQVSKKGKEVIHDFLRNYASECRNDHFHKDNIPDFETVSKIRNNTIFLFFLLLGGYKLADNSCLNNNILGIVDYSYDKLYRKVFELPSWITFEITFFNEKTVYAIRSYFNDQLSYDETGLISNKELKFIEVDSIENNDFEEAHLDSNYKEFYITRDNLPSKISYFTRNGFVNIDFRSN